MHIIDSIVNYLSMHVYFFICNVYSKRHNLFFLWNVRLMSDFSNHLWPWTTKPVIRVIYIYVSSDSWINHLSIDVWFVMIGKYLKIWNMRVQKNLNIEKIIFKVVQIKFLAMHITNQKWRFGMFMVLNVLKYIHATWSLLDILYILS